MEHFGICAALEGAHDTGIVVDVARLAPLLDSLLQRFMHLLVAEGNLIDLVDDEIAQNGNRLAVLAIDLELAAARVLVHRDQGAALRLGHLAPGLLYNVD